MKIKVGVVGLGRMGKAVVNELITNKRVESIPVTTQSNIDLAVIADVKVKITDSIRDLFYLSDIVIDFTNKECMLQCLKVAAELKKAFVSGTTGIEDVDLKEYATKIPILWSANMSIGMNILMKLIKKASELLGNDYDVEIWEMHHNLKKDSPSGTAIELGKIIAKTLNFDFSINQHLHCNKTARREKTIGFAVSRGGGVVGDHKVMFINSGEKIELSHQAITREIFAKGAVQAAIWLYDNKRNTTGLYSMQEAI